MLATPFGLEGLLFPLQVSGMAAIPTVTEWRPTVLPEAPGFQIVLGLGLFTLLYRGVRVPVLRLLLVLLTLYMSFQAQRHQALLVIVGSLLLAAPLAASFRPPQPDQPAPRRLAAALAGVALLFTGARLAFPVAVPETPSNPIRLIAALPASLKAQPVFNAYAFGGPLIFGGVKPYIDGRIDMYGDDFAFDQLAIVKGDRAAFDRAVARWHIGWTILAPDMPLVAQLDASPDWQRYAADRHAVVHVRKTP
jgi:hypothetical protein